MASWLPLLHSLPLKNFQETLATYLNMRSIAWNVIGWGGIGSFVSGIALTFSTPWKIFRFRWVTAKLILTVSAVLIGMFVIERALLDNIQLLELNGQGSLTDTNFLATHEQLKILALAQLVLFALITTI